MPNIVAVVCLVVVSSLIMGAEPTPKAFESGLTQRVNVIESDAVTFIAPDSIARYEDASDGTRFTVLHIRKSGAPALRLRFDRVRLPEGAALMVYGADTVVTWTFKEGVEDSAVVRGESAYIEIQCGAECPPDLPFDIGEVREVSLDDVSLPAIPESVHEGGELQGSFRGRNVTYTVRDGMAIMEGDIVLGAAHEILPPISDKNRQRDAVGLNYSSFLWPNGRVPYIIDPAIPDKGRVTNAIAHWNSRLGGAAMFVARTSEPIYLNIVRGSSCSSVIGRGWFNKMTLSDSCSTGVVIHELGHTLGLYHEHVRADRDQHVRVRSENIRSSALGDFLVMTDVTDDIGSYDYNSIMHYNAYAGSSNGRPTIETIPAGIPIGQRNGVSPGDVAAVRKMYGYGYTAPAPVPVPEAPAPVPDPPAPTPVPDPTPEPLPAPAPSMVSVTIAANPATERISVDGNTYTGSATLQWVVGSSHTIAAVNRESNGTDASFVRWSDGGSASHAVTANTTTTVYKADFSISHTVAVTASDTRLGSVTMSPQSPNGYYPVNTSVQLKANPSLGSCFIGWTGLIGGTPPSTTLSVTKPYAITAQFVQAAPFTLNEVMKYIGSSAGTYSVAVNGTEGCGWSAETYAPWLELLPGDRSGSGSLTYSVAANDTGLVRVAVLLIAGRGYYVIQMPY